MPFTCKCTQTRGLTARNSGVPAGPRTCTRTTLTRGPHAACPALHALAPRPARALNMPRLSVETRKRIVVLKESGYSVKDILKRLEEEDIFVGRTAVFKLLSKHKKYGCVADLKKSRPPKKLSKEQYMFIDNAMLENDELTSRQLRDLVEELWPEIKASLSTYNAKRERF